MNDQQPQYFDVGAPETAPAPWWKTPRGVRNILLAAGGLLLVVLVAVFIVNLVASNSDDDEQLNNTVASCADEEDPEACVARVRIDAAKDGKGSDACEGLTGESYVSCVTYAAYESGDPSACNGLSDDVIDDCRARAYFALAVDTHDLTACEKIVDGNNKADCVRKVTELVVDAGTCAEDGVQAELCAAKERLEAAIAEGTREACRMLSDAGDVESCLDEIAGTDEDGDGLSLERETELGTSDKDADTDGDGYNDNVEVENGHNPLGA